MPSSDPIPIGGTLLSRCNSSVFDRLSQKKNSQRKNREKENKPKKTSNAKKSTTKGKTSVLGMFKTADQKVGVSKLVALGPSKRDSMSEKVKKQGRGKWLAEAAG